jgi:tetratricopeptide (TPR) repeat protein
MELKSQVCNKNCNLSAEKLIPAYHHLLPNRFHQELPDFPDIWESYDALGESFIQEGDTAQAIQNFKKSVDINPHNTNTVEMLKKLEEK